MQGSIQVRTRAQHKPALSAELASSSSSEAGGGRASGAGGTAHETGHSSCSSGGGGAGGAENNTHSSSGGGAGGASEADLKALFESIDVDGSGVSVPGAMPLQHAGMACGNCCQQRGPTAVRVSWNFLS